MNMNNNFSYTKQEFVIEICQNNVQKKDRRMFNEVRAYFLKGIMRIESIIFFSCLIIKYQKVGTELLK